MHQAKDPPEHRAFQNLIRAALQKAANRDSRLADETHDYRYGEVLAHIEAIQAYLRFSGLHPGDCVTAELSNSFLSAITVLALLDDGYSFLHARHPHLVAASPATPLVPGFTRAVITVAPPGGVSGAEPARPEGFIDVRLNPDWIPGAGPPPDRPVVYSATSGSLGLPKIVPRSYRNFERNILSAALSLPVEPTTRIALTTPIYHQFGLGTGLMLGLHLGASLDFHDRPNALRFLERERSFEPNVALVVPTLLETLLRVRRRPRPYRFMLTGGDTTSSGTRGKAEAMHGPLLTAYGCSEFGFVAATRIEDPEPFRLGAWCRPLPGVERRLLDPDQNEGAGELLLRSDCQFDGYVNADGTTVSSPGIWHEGWFRSGDLARIGPEGSLQVLGRCDLSMNRNGMLLPFADVEAGLRGIPGVAQSAVVAGAEGLRGRALIAFCVPVPGARLTGQGIRSLFAAGHPDWSTPDEVHIIAELPLLPSGKIDRRQLSRLAAAASI